MSVYTQLSLTQVQDFARNYGLDIHHLHPIQGGIENTNYFLTAADGTEYVLTIFEELDQSAAQSLFPVLEHLEKHDIPVAVPLCIEGQPIQTLAHKPAQIAPRIAGTHPMPSNALQCAEMGCALAKMHLALQNFSLQRTHPCGQAWWQEIAQQLSARLAKADQTLLNDVFTRFAANQQQHLDCPMGLIHADLFRDNSLYVGDQLSGILDFSEIGRDNLLMDISISINDFCSDFPHVQLDAEKTRYFLQAYQQIRPLTPDEQASFAIYLAMAACRFWLLRLQVAERNQEEGRTGTDILEKDPNEMRLMLIDRLNTEYEC